MYKTDCPDGLTHLLIGDQRTEIILRAIEIFLSLQVVEGHHAQICGGQPYINMFFIIYQCW